MIDALPVTLENDYQDILVFLRNPWGKHVRGEQWTGDWGPLCDLWTKHTKKQIKHHLTNQTKATFWMSLEDVLKTFEEIVLN